jgi:hypothetical protein
LSDDVGFILLSNVIPAAFPYERGGGQSLLSSLIAEVNSEEERKFWAGLWKTKLFC